MAKIDVCIKIKIREDRQENTDLLMIWQETMRS